MAPEDTLTAAATKGIRRAGVPRGSTRRTCSFSADGVPGGVREGLLYFAQNPGCVKQVGARSTMTQPAAATSRDDRSVRDMGEMVLDRPRRSEGTRGMLAELGWQQLG